VSALRPSCWASYSRESLFGNKRACEFAGLGLEAEGRSSQRNERGEIHTAAW
jgi:hypothetical protein